MEEYVIITENLTEEYLLGKVVVPALRGVNLKIKRGEFAVIMGPSGSGKSTLLNLIGGLQKPTGGRVLINGIDLSTLNENQLAIFRRKNVGFVFQAYNLIPTLTAIENVELPMIFYNIPPNERKRRAEKLLHSLGLGDRLHHRPSELSGGEQQRVSIARALANNPEIILADEPTGNLDTKTGRRIMEEIVKVNRDFGKTIVMVTHDPEVAHFGDRIIHIRDGKIENIEILRRKQ
ncbi:MAG: ABC transporter ATP-binding protein [Caldisericia bacterium]|nr:ABC transporter ATP-binding protein [Caldisericia bacterium]